MENVWYTVVLWTKVGPKSGLIFLIKYTTHSELSEGLNLVFRWPFIVCSMLWNKKDKVYQNIWNGFQNDVIWSYQTFFVKKPPLGGGAKSWYAHQGGQDGETFWTTATWGIHIYCTGNFRVGNNSILVVDDQRGLIGYTFFFVCFGPGKNCIYNDFFWH